MPAKKHRKIINGEEYIQCSACDKWIKVVEIKNRSNRCDDCWDRYKEEWAEKRKEKGYIESRELAARNKIERELRGEIPIEDKDLFSGLPEEKIKALRRCDVEALLRME